MIIKEIKTIEELKNKKLSKEREKLFSLTINDTTFTVYTHKNNENIFSIIEENNNTLDFNIRFFELVENKTVIEKYKKFIKDNYFIFYDNLENFIRSESFRDFGIELFAFNTITEFTDNSEEIEILQKYLKLI